MDKSLFQLFNEYITQEIKKLGVTYTSEYGSAMADLFSSAIVIYIMYVGYQHLAGKRQTPIADLAWDLSKFMILLTFIQNADGWLDFITDAANEIKNGFAGGNIWKGLDDLTLSSNKLSEKIKDMDESRFGIEGAFASLFVWVGVGLLSLVSSLTLLVADITMQFMLLTAPIFIFCLMWGWLRQMFNNWLQIIFSSILTVLFISLVLNLVISYTASWIEYISAKSQADTGMFIIGFYVFCTCVMGSVLVIAAKQMASAIASVGVDGTVQGAAMFMAGALGRFSGANAAGRFLGGKAKELSGKALKGAGKASLNTMSKTGTAALGALKKLRAG